MDLLNPRRTDHVFQLSLTEIAFTVSFILLLLLGYLIFKEQSGRRSDDEREAQVRRLEQERKGLEDLHVKIRETLGRAGLKKMNVDDAVRRLIDAEEARGDRERLRRDIADLDAKLTALAELKQDLSRVDPSS